MPHHATLMRCSGRRLASFPLLVALAATTCASPPPASKAPQITCSAQAIAQGMTSFSAADVGVYFETAGDPGLEIARADLGVYLGQLWGGSLPVATTAPGFEKRATVWLSTSAAAATRAGLDAASTYAIRRVDDSAGTVVVVAAHDGPGARVENRAAHTALLYRAILARAASADPEPSYKQATALTTEAAAIVARREAHYRFDLDRLTGVYPNATIYAFGYLRPAHTQCYWRRREQQTRDLLDTGMPSSLASLPACAGE